MDKGMYRCREENREDAEDADDKGKWAEERARSI